MDTARRSRNRSSAELDSAVSRICNPLAAAKPNASGKYGAPPNAIRRYSRLQICATLEHTAGKKFAQKNKIFMDSNTDKHGFVFLDSARHSVRAVTGHFTNGAHGVTRPAFCHLCPSVLLFVKVLFSCANFSARRAHGFFIRKPGNQEFSKRILVSWFPYDFRLRLRRAVSIRG